MIITIPFRNDNFILFRNLFYNIPFGQQYLEISIQNNILYFKIKNSKNEISYKVPIENEIEINDSFVIDIDEFSDSIKLFKSPTFEIDFGNERLTIKENEIVTTFEHIEPPEDNLIEEDISDITSGENTTKNLFQKNMKKKDDFETTNDIEPIDNEKDKETNKEKSPTIFRIQIKNFLYVLRQLFISVDNFTYDMTFVYSEFIDDKIIRFYSTDDYIFSLVEIPYQKISESINHFFVLNVDYYYYLYRLFRNREGEFQIIIDNTDNLRIDVINNPDFENCSFVFERRKIRHFLSYRQFFSLVDIRTYIQFNKTKLINLLKKSYNKVLLKFVIGNNKKSMKVVFYNKFTLKKMFEINYELKRYIGQPITILVNGELLHNVLKTIRDNYVQMRIINNKKPYILNDWNGMNELKNYYVLIPSIVDLDELED